MSRGEASHRLAPRRGAQERLVGVALLVEGEDVGDRRPQLDAP